MAVCHWLSIFLVGFAVLVLRSNSKGVCPNNWVHMQGSCYKYFSKAVNWNAAKSACETLGSKLLVINSQAEQQAIPSKFPDAQKTWIGLYRDPKDKSRWLWVDGTRPTYTYWYPREPNNHGGNEDCVEMVTGRKWNDMPCSFSLTYICETAASSCQKLSLRGGVHVSPSNCLSSNQKYGSTCSFSCTRGYRLSGPSSTKCGRGGAWSAKVNTVICNAPGVDVQCNSDNMTIIIPKSLLRGIDREHLRLLDTTCKAKETSALFSLTTSLTGCSTTRRHTPTAIVYSNTVLEIAVTPKDVVTRVREIEIPFSCFYSSSGEVSSVGLKPSNRKLVFSDEGKGNFTLSLNMFPDKRFVSPYMNDDFPVAVVLRKLLFFEVSVTSGDKQLSIKADRCYATPTQDQKNSLKYEFITKGCPSDETVKYLSTPSVSTQRFSLEAFKFIAKHPFVFVHCHVIVCNATDPGSKCAKKCPSSGRGRREASDHVTGDVYSLAQGPLHLAREEKRGNVLDKSGSSPTLLMALFVMCVACLAGTALMVFKKSRDKPAGYAVLASGDPK
ncbi:hypothetical protein OS493_037660 [Desmophyllum pertusum]|uniref:ZP domain-containing protein n=1 Tax=Desmophyllum pertusum TaxID=174260 RepID=A0A9X0CZV8_9CNID|nr:hypothetical protein OS493_037660 [Desmophyllum pertusum]